MDWIRKQARLYRNLALTGRYQAVVHLEDKEDETFWNTQLQNVSPGRYRYLYYSKSDKGMDTRGCEQCLRFKPYLTNRFFVCIDSDLRLLRGDKSQCLPPHPRTPTLQTGLTPWHIAMQRKERDFQD